MSFLLDTKVISEIRKRHANAGVRRWFASAAVNNLFISALVIGEIRQGIERLRPKNKQQAEAYDAWLDTLRADYREHILPITVDIAEAWGRINARASIPAIDGLMAATAIVHNFTLVTRNVAHVAPTGAQFLNPFDN